MGNSTLRLHGELKHKGNDNTTVIPSLPVSARITSDRVMFLHDTLADVAAYWEQSHAQHKPLVAVRYQRVVPKSGRILRLLSEPGMASSNESIVGARFYRSPEGKTQHVITHCISLNAIRKSISELASLANCLDGICGGELTNDRLKEISEKKPSFEGLPLARTAFVKLSLDVCNVERFMLNDAPDAVEEMSLVTLFKGALPNNREFLRSIGISELNLATYDDSTFLLTPEQYRTLYSRAPQLIAMALKDMNEIPVESGDERGFERMEMPIPSNEPWIGVIDTPFNEDVYFSDWVSAETTLPSEVLRPQDYQHGTCVSSIIVDGPSLNPMLDDGCGRFRVRHVGVATSGRFSSFSIIRDIEQAVIRHPEVKVWNLSLGSVLEVPENFVSPEASALDRIQSEHDVLFVIAGTNNPRCSGEKRIGAPADSINSLVVNAVRFDGSPCSYARSGPVLSFFGKPDVSYYGGDSDQPLQTCWERRVFHLTKGTSFAAPWVARKLAYLIHVAGFSREAAKALVIDAACGWGSASDSTVMGYGVVPKRIEDILETGEDEIKFIITGTSMAYETYTHNIPVPIDKSTHPYKARATLCYFPHCERNQGVDYTSTELSISFGRINDERIKSINRNRQDMPGSFINEREARDHYRKWDNVKCVSEAITPGSRAVKCYESGLWGLSIKTKERLDTRYGKGIRFAVVVTLHALDGVNRIEEFIQRCSLRAWIVEEVSVENQIEIYNEGNQEIEWE